MLQNLKKRQQGFTIIEVMIVLVIAAVILLIVFLAVPALQRNSRNTQRKDEGARLLSAAGEWSNNNNGTIPNNSLTAAQKTEVQNLANMKNFTTVTFTGAAPASGDLTTISLGSGANCAGTPNSRAIFVRYNLEGSAGTTATCVDSGV